MADAVFSRDWGGQKSRSGRSCVLKGLGEGGGVRRAEVPEVMFSRGWKGQKGQKGRSARSCVFKGLGGAEGRRAEVLEVMFSTGWGGQKAEGQKWQKFCFQGAGEVRRAEGQK